MNREALAATQASGRVTFWSRSKQRLWNKGETSGHFLELRGMAADCDARHAADSGETARARPVIWARAPASARTRRSRRPRRIAFLATLEGVIAERMATRPAGSYTAKLLAEGTRRIAQKVGEEGARSGACERRRSPMTKSSAKRRICCITCCCCSRRGSCRWRGSSPSSKRGTSRGHDAQPARCRIIVRKANARSLLYARGPPRAQLSRGPRPELGRRQDGRRR